MAPEADVHAHEERLGRCPLTTGGSDEAFEAGLAREQRWTLGQARAVVREYRRFLVLTQLAGHAVCPSAAVDAAWHLHLTQTRAYRSMCLQVLGGFLDHHPSNGLPADQARHQAMYAGTLAAYRACFGSEAPSDIWPPVHERFAAPAASGSSRGIPVGHHRWSLALLSAAAAVLTGAVAAQVVADPVGPTPGNGAVLPWCQGLMLALLVLAGRPARRADDTAAGWAGSVDTYEAAWLMQGCERIYLAALAALIARGLVSVETANRRGRRAEPLLRRQAGRPVPTDLHAAELAVLASSGSAFIDGRRAREALDPVTTAIRRRLGEAGLASCGTDMSLRSALCWLASCALLALGTAAALVVPPAGGQALFAAIVAVLNLAHLCACAISPGRLSPRGLQLVDALRNGSGRIESAGDGPATAEGEQAEWHRRARRAALLGAAALAEDAGCAALDRIAAGFGRCFGHVGQPGDPPADRRARHGSGGGGGGGCGGGGCGGCGGGCGGG